MPRLLIVIPLLAIACQAPAPQAAPAPAAERPWMSSGYRALRGEGPWIDDEPLAPDLGLAPGDVADSTIERLLTHPFRIPAGVTIGILHLPGAQARRSWFTSSDVVEPTQAVADSVVAALSRWPRVTRAAMLPTLVLGDHYTVAGLREAAARLQAHVLMAYRPSCRIYERYPFAGSTQYRAVCTIDAVVLDTRSGIIPFSTVITREAATQRQRSDFDLKGTWRRVQLQALLIAAVELSSRVGTFLSAVPQAND